MHAQLALIFTSICCAAAIPFLSRRVRIPAATCEIIAGMVLFHTVFHGVPDWYGLLSELGFIYLMFIAGMESDPQALLRRPRALLCYVCCNVVPFAIMPLLFHAIGLSFYFGITVAMVSEAIIVTVLRETGMGAKPVGRHIYGMALTGELISIAVLTSLEIYHHYGMAPAAALQGLKLILLLLAAAVFLKVLYLAAWWAPQWVSRVMESDDPVEEGIRILIAVALAGALLARTAGVEPILGSFMAGMVFSAVFKNRSRFEEKINAVGFGFFTPFFFISVGASVNLSVLQSPGTLLFAALLTLAVLVSKTCPLLLGRLIGMGLRESACVTLILSAPLTMIIVAGTLGQRMGYLDDTAGSVLILTAITSSLVFPYAFRLAARGLP